jgi:hypothetical protein
MPTAADTSLRASDCLLFPVNGKARAVESFSSFGLPRIVWPRWAVEVHTVFALALGQATRIDIPGVYQVLLRQQVLVLEVLVNGLSHRYILGCAQRGFDIGDQ